MRKNLIIKFTTRISKDLYNSCYSGAKENVQRTKIIYFILLKIIDKLSYRVVKRKDGNYFHPYFQETLRKGWKEYYDPCVIIFLS